MFLRWDVFRVVALVAAGVASGYLWRAALEEPRLEKVFPVGSTSEPLPDWLQPRLQPPALERVRVGPQHVARQRLKPAARRARAAPASRPSVGRSRFVLAAATVADPPAPDRPPAPKSQPQRPPKRTKPPKAQRPSPPPPRSTPPAPPPPAPPPPPPPPPQPAAPPPAKPPPPPPADRPGWGKGDKNHDHTGPPGRGKR